MSTGEWLTLFGAVAALVAGFWAVMSVGMRQFEQRLDERFSNQEASRVAAKSDWDKRFESLDASQRRLERDMLLLQRDLPLNYVRRDDQIRETTIVNAKLDALNLKIDQVLDRDRKERT